MSKDRARKFIEGKRPIGFLCSMAMLLLAALPATAAQAAGIAWHGNIQEAAQQSAAQHKPMLVMVKARWCGPCHKMLEQTFPNPAVAARVNSQFIPVLLDSDEQAAVVQSLGIEAMPTILVISPDRKIAGRFTGFQSAAQLDARLASLTPSPIRQFAPPQYRNGGPPAYGRSLAMRPWAALQSGDSFMRRHAITNLPARPYPHLPGPAQPVALAEATEFGAPDTLTAAKAFSAYGSTSEAPIDVGPVPNPPD